MALTVTCDTCGQPLGNPACPACRRSRVTRQLPPLPAVDIPPAPSLPLPGSGPALRERRDGQRSGAILGCHRATDPPLTTRDCADWMGVTTEFIRGEIDDGKLEAEDVMVNGRRIIRVHLDEFRAYLQKIGWKRIPKQPGRNDPAA